MAAVVFLFASIFEMKVLGQHTLEWPLDRGPYFKGSGAIPSLCIRGWWSINPERRSQRRLDARGSKRATIQPWLRRSQRLLASTAASCSEGHGLSVHDVKHQEEGEHKTSSHGDEAAHQACCFPQASMLHSSMQISVCSDVLEALFTPNNGEGGDLRGAPPRSRPPVSAPVKRVAARRWPRNRGRRAGRRRRRRRVDVVHAVFVVIELSSQRVAVVLLEPVRRAVVVVVRVGEVPDAVVVVVVAG